jgi:hypothetical protein
MKMRILWSFIFVIGMTITGLHNALSQEGKMRFSSAYTDLAKECRPASEPDGEGDTPVICKGFGGYEVHITYSAEDVIVSVPWDQGGQAYFTGSMDLTKRKLEWRMADGKPFAVILRVEGLLMAKGLEGQPQIDFKVDTKKDPKANETIRALVDKNFISR